MSDAPRILVVDDTEANRYAVVRHLRKAGYLALEALDGRRALESIARELPDLVVLDIRMPEMDGFEVVRRLRADPKTAHLPILHLSASFTDPLSQAAGLFVAGGVEGHIHVALKAQLAVPVGLAVADQDQFSHACHYRMYTH